MQRWFNYFALARNSGEMMLVYGAGIIASPCLLLFRIFAHKKCMFFRKKSEKCFADIKIIPTFAPAIRKNSIKV